MSVIIQLDYRDARPIYVQIKDGVKRMIATGAMAPGERLPGIRELAATLSINPNTIARAYKELEQEGYIHSVTGKGSFVSEDTTAAAAQKEQAMQHFDSAVRELLSLGVDLEELKRRLEK